MDRFEPLRQRRRCRVHGYRQYGENATIRQGYQAM